MNYKIFTDGGSRGNPGRAAGAFVVFSSQDDLIFEEGKFFGLKTNNEAEYLAVLESLKWLANNQQEVEAVNWYLDSKLVVEQLEGNWKTKDVRMQVLKDQCFKFLNQLHFPYRFYHIPRALNARADALLNQVLDA